MRTLSFDPGKTTASWAVFDSKRLVASGTLTHQIDDLRALYLAPKLKAHLDELDRLFVRYRPTALVYERMTPRPGRGSGASAEYVNFQIGLLVRTAAVHRCFRITPVMPSVWKCWIARNYLGLAKLDRPVSQVLGIASKGKHDHLDHVADAIGIGLWCVRSDG